MSENQDMYILLKCVDKQFVESTLDGNFYFARNRYFIDLEKQQIDKGIGDEREGVWSQLMTPQESQLFIITESGERIPLNFNKGVFRQTYSNLKDCPICCFVILSLNKDFEDNGEGVLILKTDIREKLSEKFNGRDLILIRDMHEFTERIDASCKKEGFDRMCGMVTYYDDETECHPLPEDDAINYPTRTLLYKRKFFEFQKEYRIVIKVPQEKDVMLKMGDVRDISYNLGEITTDNFPIEIGYEKEGSKINFKVKITHS
ncbi:hypothetical protein [Bacillus cereus]|uniref:hypothetical protein n=1 Tax=Bacillus cereus TaxID=1396 RepID=UPI00387A014A